MYLERLDEEQRRDPENTWRRTWRAGGRRMHLMERNCALCQHTHLITIKFPALKEKKDIPTLNLYDTLT